MKRCPNCQREVNNDTNFCAFCGTEIPVVNHQEYQRVQKNNERNAFSKSADEELSGMTRVQKGILVFAAVVLVTVIAATTILLISVLKSDTDYSVLKKEISASQDSLVTEAAKEESTDPADITLRIVDAAQVNPDDYTLVTVLEAGASTTNKQDGINNGAWGTLDGDNQTSWQEGAPGNGEGSFIWYQLDDYYEIKYIALKLGSWRIDSDKPDNYYYHGNARPQNMRIHISDHETYIPGNKPEEHMNCFWQSITLPDEKEEVWIELSKPFTGKRVALTIDSVYEGLIFQDTAITEVKILGKKVLE